VAEREIGGDGGGEGAAGAVGRPGADSRIDELPESAAVVEKVAHPVAAGVAPLDEDRAGAGGGDGEGGAAPVGVASNADSAESLRLGEVRRDEVAEREELPGQCLHGRGGKQACSGLGDHHRIEHDVLRAMAAQPRRDRADAFLIQERSDLDGRRLQVRKDRVHLGADHGGGESFDASDSSRVLRGRGDEHRRAVNAVRGERQEVRLDPRPAARIGGGDRDGAGGTARHRHEAP
jgi:hypothetical protein